jgi:small GTP-binding protein
MQQLTTTTPEPGLNEDLRQYEQAKFAIAEILRSIALLGPRHKREWEERIEELLARLADDRFNLVVVGRFSRGKSSLMNAILGTDRLPTGIVPLTSVITTVAYGSKEKVALKYRGRILDQQVPVGDLPLYITQQGNPANVRGLSMAQVQLPAEFLRRGFYFVDTPGLGSAIEENTRTTETFLPQADALLLVTSFESPLSEDEIRVVRALSGSGRRVFVVINKQDTVSADERDSAARYVREQLQAILGQAFSQVFSVSARDGLAAKLAHDQNRLMASGIPALEQELTHFLLTEKHAQFLLRMCDRVADLVQALPPSADADRLLEDVDGLRHAIGGESPGPRAKVRNAEFAALHERGACEVCTHATRTLWDFLRKYQYELATRRDAQADLAEHGGLCSFHTWYYAALAAPRDVCKGYPALLEHLAASMREVASAELKPEPLVKAIESLLPTEEHCVFCAVCAEAERDAIASISRRLARDGVHVLEGLSRICVPHFAMLTAAVDDPAVLPRLLEFEGTICERLAEDMRRYALKLDAVRRFLVSDEESAASERALMLAAGHRHVNATARSGGPGVSHVPRCAAPKWSQS